MNPVVASLFEGFHLFEFRTCHVRLLRVYVHTHTCANTFQKILAARAHRMASSSGMRMSAHLKTKYTHLTQHFFDAQLRGLLLTLQIFEVCADASTGHLRLLHLPLVDVELCLVLNALF